MIEDNEDQEAPAADAEIPEEFDIEEDEDGNGTIVPKFSEEEKKEQEFYDNLVNDLNYAVLSGLSTEYLEYIEVDQKSREKRDKQYADALRRSGLGDDAPGGAEFDGASRVVHPMLAEAAIDFQSTAIKELFPSGGPVKIKIDGKVTPKKLQRADRKKRHMNWQLTKQMPEFRPSLEQILSQVPMGGVQYSKMYFDSRFKRPRFEFVPLDDIFIPFHAADFYSATRKTHRQRINQVEFRNRVDSGLYKDPDFGQVDSMNQHESAAQKANDKIEGKTNPLYDEDGLRTVYEVYCWLNIEEDKLKSSDYESAPYIMTIDSPTQKVIALYRNWDPEDALQEALQWIVEWPLIPWRGAYAIGLSHTIGGLSAAATGALRALLDSAHINNTPTALKLKGAQMSGQSANISATQIHEIDAAPGVDDIRKIAMPLPFNPPSPVLFTLLGSLVDAGKGIIRTVIETSNDYSPNIAPGTQFQMINEGMKVYSAIHARLHESMERTLSILHRLNRQNLEDDVAPPEEDNAFSDDLNEKLAYKADYEGEMDVQPVSDPNIFSDAQRVAQMGAVGQLIEKYPDVGYDRRAYNKCMLELMRIPNIDQILPENNQEKDENPVTENIMMATGTPSGVLPDQDHLAHLQVHMDFYMSQLGQNPAVKPKLVGQWVGHIVQHMLMLYGTEVKELIEKASGKPIKDLLSDKKEVRDAMSKAAAAASPLAIKSSEALLEKVVPALQEAMQYIQQIQPPMPQDPSAVAMQVEQMRTQAKQAEIQQKGQLEAAKIQAKQQDDSTDTQTEMAKIQQQDQEAKIRAQVELTKNDEDNQTALTIAGMRAVEGRAPGNLKNGNSLDQNFSNGGFVQSDKGE